MAPPRLVLDADVTVGAAHAQLQRMHLPGAPVTQAGRFCGQVTPTSLVQAPADDRVGQHAESAERAADRGETLDVVAERLTTTGSSWLPVLDHGAVVGVVGMTE